MKTTFVLPFLLGFAASQTSLTQCGGPTTNTGPTLTMQFTPSMPTQTAPTSTVYGAIMTSYLNVVDCKYVMVENVDDNPAQTGQFTTKTTVPVLTVYRVGCMPETTAVTRRDYRGYEMAESPMTKIALAESGHGIKVFNKREVLEPSVKNQIFGIAERLAIGIDPTNENITVREFKYLEQINTALFALNLVNTGFDLHQMCEYLSNATISNRLEDNLINPSQASNIICFAAQYGLYFGMSNDELLADLSALEYAIQVHAYATKTLQELCEGLDYTAASFLGIDTEGIRTYICNGTAGISSTIMPLSTSTSTSTGSMVATGSGGLGTAPTSYVSPTGIGSIVYGSNGPMLSSATSAAGTVAPWFNTTVTTTADMMTVTASEGTAVSTGLQTITSVERPILFTPQPRRPARYRF